MINKKDILHYLNEENSDCDIYIYDTVKSTNLLAKEFIANKAKDKTIIIAKHQTNGRGRQGKTFFSPAGTGIYMSMILDFNRLEDRISFITSYTAIAICRAIEQVCELKPKIKWVNDIYINNKKVAGILTEAVNCSEKIKDTKIIIGIGINVSTKLEDFPNELKNIAASLGKDDISKNKLIALIINKILMIKNQENIMHIQKIYKNYSFMIGKRIGFIKNGFNIQGTVIDINEKINLIVQDYNDNLYTLSSGEITLLQN